VLKVSYKVPIKILAKVHLSRQPWFCPLLILSAPYPSYMNLDENVTIDVIKGVKQAPYDKCFFLLLLQIVSIYLKHLFYILKDTYDQGHYLQIFA